MQCKMSPIVTSADGVNFVSHSLAKTQSTHIQGMNGCKNEITCTEMVKNTLTALPYRLMCGFPLYKSRCNDKNYGKLKIIMA